MKLPKKYEITQTLDAKLPKTYEIARNFDAQSTIKNQAGEPMPPLPPTSYATDDSKKQVSHHIVNRIAGHPISDAGVIICYEKQRGLKRIEQFNQINALMSSQT